MNANASRKFLDSRGLYNLKENDLGPIYGHQWRHWNAKYSDFNENYKNKGIDQLNNVITDLKIKFFKKDDNDVLLESRTNKSKLLLPIVYVLVHFNVLQDKLLSCSVYQRSGDVVRYTF